MSQVLDGPCSAQSPWERQQGKVTQQNQGSPPRGTRGLRKKWDPGKGRARRLLRLKKAVKAVDLPTLDAYDRSRLWRKVERAAPSECWPWIGARSDFGHGRFKIEGKLYSPHRLIYALTHGPITNVEQHHGSVVRHTCDNPGCCNPAHLVLGTQVDNVADMYARGREHHNLPPRPKPKPLAALFIDPDGTYADLPGVDLGGRRG